MDEIVVTGSVTAEATATAAQAIEYGNAVQIISAEQIAETGATNFAEIAQFLIKGANIGYSPDEGEYTIRLDGGSDRDTLVVLDGVPLYDRGPALEDIWGTTTIDPHMIERAEVFRGGNSLFFGSNGGIGVISLVTKRPDGTSKFELGAQYGAFNTREIWGNARFPIDADGRHSLMVYGGSIQTDGPRIFAPESYVDNVAKAGGIQKYPLNRGNIGIKYLWQVDDKTELRVNGQYTQIEFQDPFPDAETFSPNRVRYPIVDFTLDRRWSDNVYTEIAGYWSNPQLNNTETYPEICKIAAGCIDPTTGKTTAFGDGTGKSIPAANKGFGKDSKIGGFREMGLNVRNTLSFPDLFELVTGVQVVSYKDDSDPVFPIPNKANTITGVYADFRPVLFFSPDTKLSLALRTDFADSFGSRTIWKFGFRQPIGDFYIRGNGGTSYSLPRTNELFAQSPTLVGNPDLKTEETETYNGGIGFSKEFGNVAVNAEIGAFRTDVTNRIQTTSGLTPNTYFNNDRTTQIRGLTAELDVRVGKGFSFNVNYTKQKAHLDGSDLQINETPEYMIGGNVSWRSPDERFHITLFPRYQGPEFATGGVNNSLRHNFGNYFLMNGSIGYRLGDERQHQFQLRIVNIFDQKYAERYGYGNMRYSSAFNRGEIAVNSPEYFYGYEFEGKPRSVYISYSTKF
ncbi:TonB-dependent receptor [Sphingopyxis witflariensis]|uniref:TonB-dependent receptor n=2 Tax=Sphingopyxis witflariensis TaxID=173675 RepID=A0A246K4G6_9SPHN|nr:TonB-dependent receptor [Sphingopyxis witflariensis]